MAHLANGSFFTKKTLRRRPSITIWLYLASEFLLSFVVAFLFFFFIFFINQLLLLAEDILVKNIPFLSVLKLILYSMPTIVSLSVPFGSLVGCLMTVGRLSSDSEIISFRATGIPLSSIFTPFCIVGISLSLLSFVVNDYFLPLGTIKFIDLYRNIFFSHPELELEAHSLKSYQNDIIVTDKVEDGIINKLLIIGKDGEGNKRLITSSSGRLTDTAPDEGIITLELNNIFLHNIDSSDPGKYWNSTAESMFYNILLENISISVRDLGPRELSARDLYSIMQGMEVEHKEETFSFNTLQQHGKMNLGLEYLHSRSGTERIAELASQLRAKEAPLRTFTLQLYRVEYYKKFAMPFSAICFILFAFPAGLFSRRSGKSVGFGIGLLASFLYWCILIAGQTFGVNNSAVPAFWAIWTANILTLVIGLIIFIRRLRQ